MSTSLVDSRKERLVNSAKRAFANGGYSATSVSRIVLEAGVARGTFYQHFDNKLHLFESILDAFLQDLEERVRPITLGPAAPSPLVQIEDNLTRVLELMLRERDLTRIFMQNASSFDPTVQRRLEDLYQQIAGMIQRALSVGMAMKLVRPCDTRLTAYSIIGAVKEVIFQLMASDDPHPPVQQIARGLVEFGVGGILATPYASLATPTPAAPSTPATNS